MSILKVSNIDIGTNKGYARIWLENMTLAKIGLNRHDKIRITYYDHSKVIVVALDNNGDHHMHGRDRRGKAISILDINNAQLTKFVGNSRTARVEYETGAITIYIDGYIGV